MSLDEDHIAVLLLPRSVNRVMHAHRPHAAEHPSAKRVRTARLNSDHLELMLQDPSDPSAVPPGAAHEPPARDDCTEPGVTPVHKDDSETPGKLTVYANPKGKVLVDGNPLGVATPMINRELEPGLHEVQVAWANGRSSEFKRVHVRKGSRLKLFFRDRSDTIE